MVQSDIINRIQSVISDDHRFDIIRKVRVFGSYLDGTANSGSDIDLLVDFMPDSKVGLLKFSEIKEALSEKLRMNVDLLTERSISRYFRNDVINQAELVYER